MKNSNLLSLFLLLLLPVFLSSWNYQNLIPEEIEKPKPGNLQIGWASTDITPDRPVLLNGQFHARVSEGIMDPITVTALAIESGTGPGSEKVIMISCDLVAISDGTRDGSPDNLRDHVRHLLKISLPEIISGKIFLNGTHTHTAPYVSSASDSKSVYGVELDAMSPSACQQYIAEGIAQAAEQAWKSRKPGGISYGLGHAVVGHNRLQVDFTGKSLMYGNTNRPEFSHIEGFEDHSVNLLYTWNTRKKLTGVIINITAPSQVSESEFLVSADFWHDTRLELRKRLGRDLHILPQCSSSGDQSPHIMIGAKAEERMRGLMVSGNVKTGRGSMAHSKQIAVRIADAVTSVLPWIKKSIEWDPPVKHRMERIELSRRLIGIEDVNQAVKEAEEWNRKYEKMLQDLEENPGIKQKARWYMEITRTYTLAKRGQSVKDRFELEKRQPKMSVEVHVLRIGDIVIATNPFELYLDYGIRMKARSPAVQTFIVQLTGSGSYVPPSRSVAGGSYGAVPASTLIGPEGGQELVEKTLELIESLWGE